MRRIVYTIGEGLLVIALFTAALSAQNAMFAGPAKVAGVAPPNVQSEGSIASLPKWPNTNVGYLSAGALRNGYPNARWQPS